MKKIAKPSKKSVVQFAYFNLGGVAFFVVGYTVFAFFYGILSLEWWVAKIIGDFCGWTVNYLVQRFVAFSEESKNHTEKSLLKRFSIVSVANVPIDYAIVGGLKYIGISPFIGLWLSSLFFTVWKYIWYKWWVFRVRN